MPDATPVSYYADESVTLLQGDCLDLLATLPDNSVDAVVTDPPYGLEFMGKAWDRFDEDSKARAGMSSTGYTDGAERLDRPSFLGGLNPKCRTCQQWQRGGNPCSCGHPDFPNERRARSAAFGEWCEAWTVECLRVLKPGGHILAFGGTRTWHRLACAVEDAGFEVRDSIAWLYGSGFPKSLDVSKAIDKAGPNVGSVPFGEFGRHYGERRIATGLTHAQVCSLGTGRGSVAIMGDGNRDLTAPATEASRTWQGWGTALKPAFEPIVVARKPLVGTVAANVLAHGTGALNVDGCRIEGEPWKTKGAETGIRSVMIHDGAEDAESRADIMFREKQERSGNPAGRWPANVVLDDSQAAELDAQSGHSTAHIGKPRGADSGDGWGMTATGAEYDDQGGASRFFYVAKADQSERVRIGGIAHPTVKPLALMRWLVRLVTPPGGTVLEPFAGSGTTVEACILEGFRCIAIEREADYLPLIMQRINRRVDPVAAIKASEADGGLFDLLDGEPA